MDKADEGAVKVPTWSDYEPRERAAIITSWVLVIAGILAGPHVLCLLAGRPLSSTFAEFFFDAVVVELLGLILLVLWPLKGMLKRWLYGAPGEEPKAPTALRVAAVSAWLFAVLGIAVMCIPQGFFALTGRELAASPTSWMRDSLAAIAALAPQVLAIFPYVWAMRRAWTRMGTWESA